MVDVKDSNLDIEIEVLRLDPYQPIRDIYNHLSNQLEAEILACMGFEPDTLDQAERDMLMDSIDTRDSVINGMQVWSLVEGKKVKMSWAFTQVQAHGNEHIDITPLGNVAPQFIMHRPRLSMQAYVFDAVEDIHGFLKSGQVTSWREPVLIYPACPRHNIETCHGSSVGQIDLDRLLSEDYINLLNPRRK